MQGCNSQPTKLQTISSTTAPRDPLKECDKMIGGKVHPIPLEKGLSAQTKLWLLGSEE